MATAQKVTAVPQSSFPPRRRFRGALLLLALAALFSLAWFWPPLAARALTGASYGARIACSCRFVAGRTLASCRDDLEPGMGMVRLSEDAEAKSVTAWVPLLASQTATLHEGQGCALENWEN